MCLMKAGNGWYGDSSFESVRFVIVKFCELIQNTRIQYQGGDRFKMKGLRYIYAVSFMVFLSTFVAAQASWTPETQVKTRAVGTPRISPDKTRVVYTINEAVMAADKSEF